MIDDWQAGLNKMFFSKYVGFLWSTNKDFVLRLQGIIAV